MDHGPSWTLDRLHTDDRLCLLRVQSPETPSFSHSRHSPHLDFWRLCFPTDGSHYLAVVLCYLFSPTGHILIFGIVEWKWMKETDPSSEITWQWKIKPWRWFLKKLPIPHAAWPSLRFLLVVFVCVCNVVETVIWNTLEHLKPGGFWTSALIYKKNDGCSKNNPLSS